MITGELFNPGIGIGLAALMGAIAAKFIKLVIRRQRPSVYSQKSHAFVDIPDPFSFPSGHTTTVFTVFAVFMTLALPGTLGWLLFAIGVGISRVYLGVHFPTDVLACAALGLLCGGLIAQPLSVFFL